MGSILIVEDDAGVASLLQAAIAGEGMPTILVGTLEDAFKTVEKNETLLVVLDLNLPCSRGEKTLIKFQERYPNIPIIVVSSDERCDYVRAIHLGAEDYFEKPHVSPAMLLRSIRHATARHRVRSIFTPIEEDLAATEDLVQELKSNCVASGIRK